MKELIIVCSSVFLFSLYVHEIKGGPDGVLVFLISAGR